MSKFFIRMTAVIAAVLVLAGCPGNNADETGTGTGTAPDTPKGVTVTSDEGQLAVAWQPAARADTYEVKWGGDEASTKTGITGTGWLITGLADGTTYPVQVRAKNASGESGWSDVVNGTPAAAAAVPETPEKPAVTASGDTLTVTWTGVTDATKYQVFYGSSASPTTQYGSDISGTSVKFIVPGNGMWYVRIKAGNSKGYSDYSPDASVTVSGVASVLGSWKRNRVTYEFGENGKLTYTYTDNDGSADTSYYIYDSAKKELYWGRTSGYTLSGDSLYISLDQDYQLTSGEHNGLIGTWTREGGPTVEITAAVITIGSDVYPYYTYTDTSSGGSGTRLVYKDTDEPDGRYALSGGKLQFTSIERTTYEREGSGSGITGTWKHTWSGGTDGRIWTFNSDETAEYKEVYNNGEQQNKQNYSYTVSGTVSGGKITLDQEVGTLSGSTFTFSDIPFSRTDSGSGVIGTWTGSYKDDEETITINVTITPTELQYTQSQGDESESGSWPIRISDSGNSIYFTQELGFKLEGSSLTIIEEYTDEYEPVSP